MKSRIIWILNFIFVLNKLGISQTFKKIGVEDGLPSSIIYDLKADKYNRIWIASFGGGIACYDGIKFTTLNSDLGLNNDLIRNITIDEKNGNILVGSQGAFELITQDSIINLSNQLNDPLGVNVILTAIYGNTVYTSSENGFISLVDQKRQEVIKKITPIGILFDNDNNLWLPTRNKLYVKLANGELINFSKDYNFNAEGLTDIKKYKNLIIISSKNGLFVFDKFKLIKTINNKNGLKQDFIRCLFVDGNVLWLGTKDGLVNTTDLEKFKYFDSKNGIDVCEIKCMCLDKNGLLWVGSNGGGLYKMIKSDIVKYNFNAEPIAFAIDSKKKVYALTKNEIKLFNTDSDNFESYLTLKDIPNPRSFCIDKHQNFYLIAGDKGVIKLMPNNKTKIFKNEMKMDNPAMSVLETENHVWMGFKRSLLRYNTLTEKVDTFKAKDIHAQYFQDIIAFDTSIIIATEKGLTSYYSNSFHEISSKTSINFPEGIVNSIELDKYKHLWVAADRGLFCYEGKETFSNYRKDFFPTNEIWDIAIIDTFLFAATNKGLIQVAIKPKNNKNCVYQIINKRNGLIDFDLTAKAIFADSTYIWIAHKNGAYRYKPINQLKLNITVYISNVFNDYGSLVFRKSKNFNNQIVNPNTPLKLNYSDNDFTIEFKGINYNLLDNVFYSYRLVGLNSNWSLPSNETKAVYTNLNPGEYTFELSASNGKINFGKVVSYKIFIKPPFYKTWWFNALIILFILIIIYLFIQIRLKTIKRQNAILETKVIKRTHELNIKSQELVSTNNELLYKDKLITESLDYAKKIQESILPSEIYLKKQFNGIVKTASIYLPKDIVSGDFYYASKKENYCYFALVDCTGHGVPGALLSFSVSSLLHGVVDKDDDFKAPSFILKKLLKDFSDIYVKEQDVKESFAISLICYNYATKKILLNGISQSIVLLHENTVTEIKSESSFLTGSVNPVNDIEIPAQSGSRLYLFSDGYYDQKNEVTKKRMYKSVLIKKIHETGYLPINHQLNELKAFFMEFKGLHQQIDDVTIFAIEID